MFGTQLESEKHFRQIADNLPAILALSNADLSEFLFVSRAYEQIWGRSVESLYANSWSFLEGVHERDRERFREALRSLIQGTPMENLECIVVRPDGSERWVACRGFPVRDSAGQIIRLVGSAEDITERKRAENALRESEDRYRDLVEHSSDLICTHDAQGILLSVNETPLRLLGYLRSEMVGRRLRDFVTPEARQHCDAYLALIQRDGFAKGLLPVVAKSGEVRLWEFSNSLRTDGAGARTVRGLAHDVTEQKRVEKALRKSEEKFAKAFRSSPVEMMITSLEEGRLLDVNETFERNLGCRREEIIGRTTVELGLWTDRTQRNAMLEEIKRNSRVVSREIQIKAKSGQIRYKLYSAEMIYLGKAPCLLNVSEDITDRKRVQENLLRSEAFLAEGQRLSHTGSWSWNPNTGEMSWSVETFRILRLDREKVTPNLEVVRALLAPDDRPLFERTIEQMAREESEGAGDCRVALASGEIKHLHCVARPVFDSAGKLIEFVGTAMDVTERKRTEDELRRLSGQLLRLYDEERHGIARDLHDTTGQGLVALAATLSQLQASVPATNRHARKLIAECMSLAKECVRDVRTLSYVLYPPMLEQGGLEDAIRHFRDGFMGRTGIQVALDIPANFARLPREIELALFRVMQESLANIQRHSGSGHAEIRLSREPGLVVLQVRDQGRGMPARTPCNGEPPFAMGVGIASMHERVKQVGGRLEISSGSDGTVVRAAVPAHD